MSKETAPYAMSNAGRVKAAGVPMDVVFDPSGPFRDSPTLKNAQVITETFANLRQSPPDEIRNRFFPRDRGNKSMFRSGPLLLRPILKTDQGAGQFLPFDLGTEKDHKLRFQIDHEEGYFIPEIYFERQLQEKGYPSEVMNALSEVERQFQKLDIPEAQLAYERMQIACEKAGIVYQREAQVGRDALFFIRPTIGNEPIRIPLSAQKSILDAIYEQVELFTERAIDAKKDFAQKQNLGLRRQSVNLPPYFQVDVQLFSNGEAKVDQIQIPDVGLFLTTLNADRSLPLQEVQKRVEPLLSSVSQSIMSLQKNNTRQLFLVTRPEVLQNDVDVLEIREIQAISQGLDKYGFATEIISVDQACFLQPADTAFFLNVDTQTDAFNTLLKKNIFGEGANFYPDPFLITKLNEMTGYQRIKLDIEEIDALKTIVSEVEGRTHGSGEKQFIQLLALDNFLTKLGLLEDVFHMYISSQNTPVACYRYDAKGFQNALNYIKPGDHVEIRSIPISPENAVLVDPNNRPIYSVFRFMVFQEGI